MTRLASWNVNGIRACHKSGFLDWLAACEMDVVGLQEVRAEPDQVPADLRELPGWHKEWYACERKKGYSGVGILSRVPPLRVTRGIGISEIDCEGRIIAAEFEKFWFVSAYFPNSGEGAVRLEYKLTFCREIQKWLDTLRVQGKPVVLAGDYNVAPQPIDLARPKDNEKTAGYLPEERAWMNSFLESGWVDTFRHQHPDTVDAYSWWSMRMRARERNVGWRIDFHCVHTKDRSLIRSTAIHPSVTGSDHCPVSLELAV